ncbi:MAG: radical SAM protein [Candidatus Woesearchaeota archaeon]
MRVRPFYQVCARENGKIYRALSSPINLNILVTTQCNCTCVHCCANASNQAQFLSKDGVTRIIQQAEKNKIFYFVLTGGEPLMYKHIWYLMDNLLGRFGIIMNTNGTLVNRRYARKLASYNLASVHVSLDAADQTIYRKQRGSGTSLAQVCHGIQMMIDEGIPVTTKTVITNLNKESLNDIVNLSIRLGVKRMNFAWFKPMGRGLQNYDKLNIQPDTAREIAKNLYILKKRKDIQISIDESQFFPFLLHKTDLVKYRKLCGDYFLRIDYNGDVFPCPFLDTKLGNIFRTELSTIWRSQVLAALRQASLTVDKDCISCEERSLCIGGCRARSIYVNNHVSGKDPICWGKND